MKPNYKDLADFARLGLRFRILPPASIAAWADGVIAEGDIPEPWLIDLSLANTADAIEDALRQVPGEPQGDLAVRLFLALVLRRWCSGCLCIGDVRDIGWVLHAESALADPEGKADWGILLVIEGEALDEGHLTEQKMRRSIDEKLSRYSCLDKILPKWA